MTIDGEDKRTVVFWEVLILSKRLFSLLSIVLYLGRRYEDLDNPLWHYTQVSSLNHSNNGQHYSAGASWGKRKKIYFDYGRFEPQFVTLGRVGALHL